jgi:hypothetical protein
LLTKAGNLQSKTLKNTTEMKKTLQYTILTALLVFSSAISLNAQPHAGQQSGSGVVSGDRIGQSPGGAPIGSGNFLLIGLALLYATKKVVSLRRQAEA